VRLRSRPSSEALRRLGAVAALASVLGAGACTGTSTTPTPPPVDPGPPTLTCPPPQSVLSPLGNAISVAYSAPTVAGGLPPLTGPTCTPPAGSMFVPGVTGVTCTVTDGRQRTDSCTFTVTITLPPKLTVTRFLAFGDSITWGEDGSSATLQPFGARAPIRPAVQLPAADTYPGALQADLRGRYTLQSPTVTNGGKPLESVTDPGTFPRFVSFTSSGLVDAALIMEGANDISGRDDRVEPAVIVGLGRMIDDARSRGIRPMLATIPPENPSGPRGLAAGLVPGFNDRVRGLALSKNVPLVDVYQAFGGDLSLIGFDGLHPNAAGYHRIADTFFDAIKQNLETPAPTPTVTAPLVVRPRRR
jgi:lysophospholipase L1-like esterase